MDQSKNGFLTVLQGVKLSQTQCPTAAEDREKMKVIPYALAIGSTCMQCCVPDLMFALLLVYQGGAKVIQEWITG